MDKRRQELDSHYSVEEKAQMEARVGREREYMVKSIFGENYTISNIKGEMHPEQFGIGDKVIVTQVNMPADSLKDIIGVIKDILAAEDGKREYPVIWVEGKNVFGSDSMVGISVEAATKIVETEA